MEQLGEPVAVEARHNVLEEQPVEEHKQVELLRARWARPARVEHEEQLQVPALGEEQFELPLCLLR